MYTRPATPGDFGVIARIYNQGIEDRIATFETQFRAEADIAKWSDGLHPLIVVEEEQSVLAFAATSTYRSRSCYEGIAEVSLYVERAARRRGIGRVAMDGILRAAEQAGFWKLVSRIFLDNHASRRLVANSGFREVGVYEKHGKLDGVWRDVVIVERLFPANLK